MLAVYVVSATGEQRILAILGQNAIVGELAMIDALPRSASVRALRDCELTFVSRAAFTDMLRRHPELYNDIVTTLAARLRQTDEDMAASSFQTVRSRVARALTLRKVDATMSSSDWRSRPASVFTMSA